MNTAALVTALVDQLGFKLVAYIGGVQETRIVRQWAQGTYEPTDTQDVERLRLAFRAASLIMTRQSADVAQAWFQGLNPDLGDISPARLLREGDTAGVGPQVLAAARQFAALG
ncbi:hypothetical protein [Mycobacteroides abscessus]|uniref:hypothetical protein n=1 Tax=Mycobacteroides abscessus TaxID=36809 RepID=UPI00092B6A6E|nr:hypothetical protein [Mycobacteroides abscessus]SHX65279.1 Uncharacterised protein [Mycobacteroides abscessus subsp. abscessus]SHY16202.1 Uncharacterised protein [Mycobacteroides abscessus subsp. abscessus]SIB55428.1 Uncharacterised protein [Mycobacteroides abscessus subsp. abscessus]SIB94958.1 Uncharacterised protein [Mycobacteroides abscessus subsp. abscessus]SIC80450.1 Uncharacterised protein [Mycobacteroides abscessus subsp. abscessus]